MNVNFIESSPTPVKAALAMMGMMEETLRLPLVPLTEPSRVKLKKVLADLKLA
jgi:4-hydroxy-tetrahydrodipicolinate synthase